MNRKDERREWRTSLYEKRERARQELALRATRKQARRYLQYVQHVEFRGYSLLQLLHVIVNNGPPLAGEMAVEQIELNERNISASDRAFLNQIKARLAERKDCSRQLVGKA